MGLYNFHPRFAPFIEDGRKQHTIRGLRACPDVPGNILHLYTGLRTRKARLLGRFPCTKIERITISKRQEIAIDGRVLSIDDREALARLDGFADFKEMMAFWNGRRPFRGQIIHWQFSAACSQTSSHPSQRPHRRAG